MGSKVNLEMLPRENKFQLPPTPGLNSLTSATRKKQDLVESPYMKCRSNERRGAAFSQALRTGSQGQLALPLHFTT